MKTFLIILLAFIGCNNPKPVAVQPQGVDSCTIYRQRDSLLIVDLNGRLADMSLAASSPEIQGAEGLRIENDSLRSKLFLVTYKVERVRYYLNIALRNPSQDKFLKGWVKRAIE